MLECLIYLQGNRYGPLLTDLEQVLSLGCTLGNLINLECKSTFTGFENHYVYGFPPGPMLVCAANVVQVRKDLKGYADLIKGVEQWPKTHSSHCTEVRQVPIS